MRELMIILPLLFSSASDGGQTPTPAEQFEALVGEWKSCMDDYFKAVGEAKSDQEQNQIIKENDQRLHAFGIRALELVRKHPEAPEAVDALVWVVQNGKLLERGEALEILRRDHIESERIGPALPGGDGDPSFPGVRIGRSAAPRGPVEEPPPRSAGTGVLHLG